MQWEEMKERYIKTRKTKLRTTKTRGGIHRVLKLTNFMKHYMKLYRECTTKDVLWTHVTTA